MNQFVYNNKIFYFDSAKYSVNSYYNSQNTQLINIQPNIQSKYYQQENIQPNIQSKSPENINLLIKIVPIVPIIPIVPRKSKQKKVKPKEYVAGKGYVAAKSLNKFR
jgi:hypothetical protein